MNKKIHNDYYNICKAFDIMKGNILNTKEIWNWIIKNENNLIIDKVGNIVGSKETLLDRKIRY